MIIKKINFTGLFLLVVYILFSQNKTTKEEMENSLNNIIQAFKLDYGKISGLYSYGSYFAGDASPGPMPAFKIGASCGTIFFTNPLYFFKYLDFGKINFYDLLNQEEYKFISNYINWFNDNFLPIPITNYFFELSLSKRLSIASYFHILPIGDLLKTFSNSNQIKNFLNNFMIWGIGGKLNYSIIKEFNSLPSISVGFGYNYSDLYVEIKDISIENIYIDLSNDKIKADFNFFNHISNYSFILDLNISKTIYFFQPFVSFKFVQTVNHNLTKINIKYHFKNVESVKDIYGDGAFTISNKTSSCNNYDIGEITPFTEFIFSTGFEFIISIFRLGIEGSYGFVSKNGLINLNLRFQVEKKHIEKLKSSTTTKKK